MKYLQYESVKLHADLKIEEALKGWWSIIKNKCHKNELMDVASVNMPTFEHEIHDCSNLYFFAGFFRPG